MKRWLNARHVALGLAVVVAFAAGFTAVRMATHRSPTTPSAHAVYYCPMHPTYTSDRPGDCPICSMKLVKREEPSSPQPQPTAAKDICYLHNCPMAHEGKPCPMLVVAKAGEKITCPICGMHIAEAATPKAKKILYWTDSMIPGYKSDKPGKSPMGMELVPVYEEAGGVGTAATGALEGYAPILVTPQKRQFIGVTTAVAQQRSLTKTIRTAGRIAYDPELYQAEQEYLQALKTLHEAHAGSVDAAREPAGQLVDASRMRLRLLGLSQELIDEIATWEQPDQSLLVAGPEGRVWLYAPVYEFDLPLVRVGQTVTIEVPTVPGTGLAGVIRAIDPVLDPATRSARVRTVLDDAAHVLKPEMFVNASIAVPIGTVLAVPESAILDTGLKRIVFVDKGEGIFEPRDVTVGVKTDGYAEIRSGVSEGEVVVTSGNFLIDSESRLKAALQGMAPSSSPEQEEGGHAHGP